MGAAVSSDNHPEQADGDPNSSSFRFLMGKIKNVSPATQRLFAMGKLYLSPENEQVHQDKSDFDKLFPALDEANSAQTESRPEEAFKLFHPLKKSTPLHHGQTYVQWRIVHDYKSYYTLCMQKKTTIYIQPIDEFPEFVSEFRFKSRSITVGLFEMLQGFAQIYFGGLDVQLLPKINTETLGWNITSRYHDVTGQKQYLVSDYYPYLQKLLPSNGACILGFVWTDLFPENFNFVLGEASVQHRTGIFCFGRFPLSSYIAGNTQDLTAITGDVIWRLLKVVSHEVCHLFGLSHCTYFQCAMNESNRVEEAIEQPLFLCPVCLRKLHRACGFDVLERYQEMLRMLTDIQVQFPCASAARAIRWLEDCLKFLNS